MAIQIGLVAAVIALLAYQKLTAYIVPFVGVWLFLNPVSLSLSLQFSPMFILTLVELIIILWQGGRYEKDRDRWIYHFFIVGCLTSFFDLLTYPLVTLGIPVAYLIVRYCDCLKDCVISFLKATAAWGCGYVLMWSGKWAVGSLISQTNILEQATDSLKFRTGYEFNDVTFTYLDVLLSNLDIRKGFLILVLLSVFTLLCVGLYKKHKFEARHAVFLLVALMPMGWYLAIPNHSYIHRFFTYRELSITVFALLLNCCFCCAGYSSYPKDEPTGMEKGGREKES